MIQTLTLKKFQAHEKLKLKLDPHITSVVGPSDIGKSSIIRALRWLCFNRPAGEAFIREGSESAKVTLEVDGHTIQRQKWQKGKGNSYKLDGQKLEAFKADVPEPVAKLLNISEVNFQQQHDPPFWFSETAGEVSRQLNSIINLGEIDSTLGYLGAKIRENQMAISVGTNRLAEAKAKRKSLRPIRQAHRDLCVLEDLEEQIAVGASKAATLAILAGEAWKAGDALRNAGNGREEALAVAQKGQAWAEGAERRDLLAKAVGRAKGLRIVAQQPVPALGGLLGLGKALEGMLERRDGLRDSISEATRLRAEGKRLRREAAEAEERFKKAMGKTCPLCGGSVK